MGFGNTVNAFNRTTTALACKWDGIDYVFEPGDNHNTPIDVALKAIEQNPIMGTANPYEPADFKSLIGIKDPPAGLEKLARKYPHEPFPIKQSGAIEVLDRSALPEDRQQVKVRSGGKATKNEAYMGTRDIDASVHAQK